MTSNYLRDMSAAAQIRVDCKGSSWGTRAVGLDVIRFYQTYLSPYKGFSCPHRLLHTGVSCSGYIAALLESGESWPSVWVKSFQRLQDCAVASRQLSAEGPKTKCWVIPCCIPL